MQVGKRNFTQMLICLLKVRNEIYGFNLLLFVKLWQRSKFCGSDNEKGTNAAPLKTQHMRRGSIIFEFIYYEGILSELSCTSPSEGEDYYPNLCSFPKQNSRPFATGSSLVFKVLNLVTVKTYSSFS